MPMWAFGSEVTSSAAWPGPPSPTCSTSAGPFGRLALTHVLMTAGDTMFAVSLAGSLFFSISPTAAKDKVLLYLLLTMGPFAVVAPALGPVVDRSRGARRATVVASALGRAVLCPFLARDIHSLLLFPEAFAMLVLSKVYLVTKGALVPEMAALGMLDEANDPRSAAAETGDGPVGPRPSRLPTAAVTAGPVPPARATPPYGTPLVRVDDPVTGDATVEPDLATLNARLGLLASFSGFAFALPAVAILKLGGAPWFSGRTSPCSWPPWWPASACPCPGGPGRRDRQRRAATGPGAVDGRPAPPIELAPDVDESGPVTRRIWPPSGPSPAPR